MTIQEATYFLLNKLRTVYADGEAGHITDMVMEYLTGSKKAERMIYKHAAITTGEEDQLQQIAKRLMEQEPVQYVLNEAWFYGFKFYVDNNVLIPRPETEELVDWVIKDCKFPISELNILDIGAGSGCIAISLKRKLRKAAVWACDSSEAALKVAGKNAATTGVDIQFIQLDFLQADEWKQLPSFDIIISNPPYVPLKDKDSMQKNVVNHEPALALFVPDDDALIFYKAIAAFSKTHLKPGGIIYMEIYEEAGIAVKELFETEMYTAEIKKDMQGKERMVKAFSA